MAECPFCFTALDDRATVCKGCGAKKGYGYHSSYGVLSEDIVRLRIKRFNIAKSLIIVSAVIIFFILQKQDDVGISGAFPILLIGIAISIFPFLGSRVWINRLKNGNQSWFK